MRFDPHRPNDIMTPFLCITSHDKPDNRIHRNKVVQVLILCTYFQQRSNPSSGVSARKKNFFFLWVGGGGGSNFFLQRGIMAFKINFAIQFSVLGTCVLLKVQFVKKLLLDVFNGLLYEEILHWRGPSPRKLEREEAYAFGYNATIKMIPH